MGSNEWLVNVLAGGLSGMTVDFVLYPLDTIKTRLQARNDTKKAARHAVREALGSKQFYRGLTSAMLGSFPGAATFWMTYQASKTYVMPYFHGPVMEPAGHMICAALADVAVCAVRNPFEVVKQQMQVGIHTSTVGAVKEIARVEGLRGFYAGYWSTVLREMPFDALQFALYEALKRKWRERKGSDLVLWENALLGTIAGGFAGGITTPLDVVKTRLMTQFRTEKSQQYTGFANALRRIAAEEGFGALFSGIKTRMAWISIGGAIFIGSYEEGRRQIQPLLSRPER